MPRDTGNVFVEVLLVLTEGAAPAQITSKWAPEAHAYLGHCAVLLGHPLRSPRPPAQRQNRRSSGAAGWGDRRGAGATAVPGGVNTKGSCAPVSRLPRSGPVHGVGPARPGRTGGGGYHYE